MIYFFEALKFRRTIKVPEYIIKKKKKKKLPAITQKTLGFATSGKS